MAAAGGVTAGAALPRLLYIGDVSVADTMAGEALLFRLLQFYPPDKLAVICGVRPDMPMLPGVAYHHWGPAFPSLLYSRVASEYILWRAWRYYEVPAQIAHIATLFRAEAVLTISHVSAWLAAWQLSAARRLPLHLIAHDDFVYASRFPAWSRGWAERKFGEAYRAAQSRFCISDTMEEIYRSRFGAPGSVIYPTFNDRAETLPAPRRAASRALTFAYGGSLNSAEEIDQMVAFARLAVSRGHRLVAFTPQHALVSQRAAAAGVAVEARPPVPSETLKQHFRNDADCLLLPQSLDPEQRPWVATAFPSKWADYATLGLPVLVWAPPESSSARFVAEHPGCAELVTSADPAAVTEAMARLERSEAYRQGLADTLLRVGAEAFSPRAAWQRFRDAITQPQQDVAA
jgi:hypothetical protein